MSRAKGFVRDLDTAWEELGKALDRLNPDHKREGRNNSRARVIGLLARTRALMDAEFPNIPKPRKKPRKARTPNERMREFIKEMEKKRYIICRISNHGVVRLAVECGVKVHYAPDIAGADKLMPWVPIWLRQYWDEKGRVKAQVRRLAKDRAGQRILEAEWRLKEKPGRDVTNF